jgi:DNA-binding CsgD family transcriptional regulator
MGDPATVGHTLNRLGNWHANVEQPLDGQRYHQEALAIFQELGDRPGIAETVDLLGMTSYTSGNLIEGRAYYERAVALFRELDDRQGLASSLTSLAELSGINSFTDTAVSAAMPVDERVHTFEAALKVAREIGWRSQEAYTLLQLASFLGPVGAYARALEAARAGLAIAEEIEHRQWMTFAHCMLGILHRDLLALLPARQHLERAMELTWMMNSPFWVYNVTELLAATSVLLNDYARAESILNTALALDAPTQTMGQCRVWCARAELTLARGDAPQALHIVDRLIASTPNVSEERIVPRLWKLRGEALAMLHRVADAESVLRAALDGAAAQKVRPLVWRIHVILGRLLADQARHDDAGQEFAAARAIIEDLAAGIDDEALRDTFLQNATARLPRPQPLSPLRAAKRAYGGLTAREREVAAHIAQGLTNRQIAGLMVVSDRTVETHVSSILAKLDFSSRAQIAAWAAEKGLRQVE